jgi:hypothetical protein
MTTALYLVTLSSLLKNFKYHLVLSFIQASTAVAFDPSDPTLTG